MRQWPPKVAEVDVLRRNVNMGRGERGELFVMRLTSCMNVQAEEIHPMAGRGG